MKNSLFTLLIFFSIGTSAKASLMFSPQEVRHILEKRTHNEAQTKRHNDDYLTCHGILFQNDLSWSVWLNGEKLSSSCPPCREGKIKIQRVSQSHISLEWQHKGTRHKVTLKPNESYDATLKKTLPPQ